jgi:dolichol-phosphate mannosyltransferase
MLVEAGALAPPALTAALEEQDRDGGRLGALLQARGAVERDALRKALADHFAMDTVTADDVPVALLPAAEARRLRAVALWPTAAHEQAGTRVVAFGDPTPERIAAVSRRLGTRVRPLVVDDHTLDELLERAYARHDALAVAHAFRSSRQPADAEALPTVSVVAPLAGESAECLRRLWTALDRLDFPVARLQGVALVDTADGPTQAALAEAPPPAWLRATRIRLAGIGSRAALALHGVRNARGDLTVVLDPESPPAADHLRRAAEALATPGAPGPRLDVEDLLATWAAPGRGTTCCETRGLARALGWEPPQAADGPVRDRSSVWVCVPTYNEAATVQPLCRAVLATLRDAGIDGHVLVIDDGSPDGTGALAEELRATEPRMHVLHRRSKDGIGPAYLAGFAQALANGADLIVEMDCDFSHDPAVLPRLVEESEKADVVLGSRYVAGGRIEDWPLVRRLISSGGCWYARRMLAVQVRDLTGGFKCFRRHVLEELLGHDVRSAGYGFQIEMTYRALLAGSTVHEVPIAFRDRVEGESKMSWAIALEAAVNVVGLRRLGARTAVGAQAPLVFPVGPRRDVAALAVEAAT